MGVSCQTHKTNLKKTLAGHKSWTDEFDTLLTQVEAIDNSLPLTPLDSALPDGYRIIIPAHFLMQRPLLTTPIRSESPLSL